MGGFFGIVSKKDCIMDTFFGVDYHSHLGTKRGGMASYSAENGFKRYIHNIENSPFRTKFENDITVMQGNACIGAISDTDPQPILIYSKHGVYAICTIGIINNMQELTSEFVSRGKGHFTSMESGRVNSNELVAALIDEKDNFKDGILYANERINGSLSVLILTDKGEIITARDKFGRLPVLIGKNKNGFSVSFESFAYQKTGYKDEYELGPGEVVKLTPDGYESLSPAQKEMRICAFLWTYYGYPNSCYEGINVEVMRTRNGHIMARNEKENGILPDVDYICGVPDSGVPHAIGYSNESGIPFARPFIKYTPTWPRSFMPAKQSLRNQIAKMKLIPVNELIKGKKLLFVDDSIVRGTQLRETAEFLLDNGAKEVHMRSACPPIMFSCKYLNFSRSTSEMDLIARNTISELEGLEGEKHLDEYINPNTERGKCMRSAICKKLNLTSLQYQTIEGIIQSIGIDPCKVCTYCWTGKE